MKIFENVEELELVRLRTGQIVKTKGYITPNDGGGAEYLIVASGTGTADGGSYIDIVNAQAHLRSSNIVDIKQFGAIGDASTINNTFINNAISYISSIGGGEVVVPEGDFYTDDNIVIKDNVYLVGKGYGSHIRNIGTSGFVKCTLITGNMGDPNNSNSMFDETGYDLDVITKGDFEITLISSGDASSFTVGDIIGIQSFETWGSPAPNNKGIYLNQNEITEINGAVITLRYAVPDAYTSSSGNRPTLHTLSGAINGYDGQPLFMAKNCGAKNLRVTQSIGLTSGWYAIFPCGINQRFEDIWMDDCSTALGVNNLSYSYLRNLHVRFEAGFLDFAEFVNNNKIVNCIGTRIAANPVLNRIGIACSKGTDNTFINVKSFLDGWGRVGANQCHRAKFIDCDVYDSGSASDTTTTEAILLGFGDDCEARNCRIEGQHKYGVQVVGERSRVTECKIPSTNTGYSSVYCPSTLDVVYVHNNEFGTEGSITSRDRFEQQIAQSPNAMVYNNTGYIEHELKKGGVVDANFASSNQTGSYETLKTTTLKAGTGVVRRFKVLASGVITGTTSTKVARLMLGTDVLIQGSFTATPSGAFRLECDIVINEGDSARCSGVATQETTVLDQSLALISSALTTDKTLTFEAQVANSADSINIYQFIVEAL